MFKRGGTWYVTLYDQAGAAWQRSTGTTNRDLARRMARMVDELRDQRQWDALALVIGKTASVGQLWDAYSHGAVRAFVGEQASPKWATLVPGWMAALEVVPATRTMYRMQAEAVLPAGARVSAITTGAIRDGLAALDVSAATKRNYLAAVSSFCTYLVAHDLLPVSPAADGARLPRPKKGKPRTVWMTAAEDERLCKSAPSPYREYFALVHGTGAERGAALAMTRDDVDMARQEVRIRGTKTATRDRSGVPVDPWAWAILAPYVKTVLRGPLFPTLSKWLVNRMHPTCRAAAKLDLTYSLRDARHSVAIRWLVLDKVEIWDVAERLGHADMSMAIKVYTKTVLRDAAKRLGVAPVKPTVTSQGA
jgi:integrase